MDRPETIRGGPHEAFARSALDGLSRKEKAVEPRWLYDDVGAKLFEAITLLDHYYPTRTEMALLADAAPMIADALGEGVAIVEPGSGEALKVRPLLEALGPRALHYVPIDIAALQLEAVAREMAALYPHITVTPVAADFFQAFAMPKLDNAVVFFPGSTIGNMAPAEGAAFLKRQCEASGARRALVGVDLEKPWPLLQVAYDDPAGVTAAFMKNVLQRMNRELGADFVLSDFGYTARWSREKAAVEMVLTAGRAHTVRVAGTPFAFEKGEELHVEDSRKFTPERFAALAAEAGLAVRTHWSDDDGHFGLFLLEETGAT